MILIIYAHPYPHHSHANKRMLEQARTLEGVEIRSLYQLYPDFNIDIAAEQEALSRADLIVWQHPMQWYSIPPLLKLWIDKVFSHGWVFGSASAAGFTTGSGVVSGFCSGELACVCAAAGVTPSCAASLSFTTGYP